VPLGAQLRRGRLLPAQPRQLQGLVAAQAGGIWQDATQVPGLATLNIRDNAHADLVSCSHAGKCVIAGTYTDTAGHAQVFVTGCPNILGFRQAAGSLSAVLLEDALDRQLLRQAGTGAPVPACSPPRSPAAIGWDLLE